MITYRQAFSEDLQKITNTHLECFPNYFLSSLGFELVHNLYLTYLEKNSPFVVAVNENNDIVGFCAGYIDGSNIEKIFEQKTSTNLL